MTEDFLHYLWKYKLLDPQLTLFSGEDCEIIDAGMHNKDSGPDFFNAKVKIGDTLWAGNVEIHINASEWYHHKHHQDQAYDNIVLHVVYNNDRAVKRKNGELMPTLEVKGNFNEKLFDRYNQIIGHLGWIPCENLIGDVKRFTINSWLDRLLIERLEEKSQAILERYEHNNQDWEETFYQVLARNFGFKVNAMPFEMLARSIPFKILMKYRDQSFQVEALLFGQAGLLSGKFRDEYPRNLLGEYQFLRNKYNLKSIEKHLWRFMRLCPANFPTLRIAQLAAIISSNEHLFRKMTESDSLSDYYVLFDVTASSFWENHYNFGKKTNHKSVHLGKNAINLILINTIIPFLFVYGRSRNDQRMIDRSIKLLEQIPGESNMIIRKWKEFGMSTNSAFNTQALLELHNKFCMNKKCLDCAIGNELLRGTPKSL
ncbi:MAG: DUF2851 family protein [Bacteroidales bacterium]|nr:DUF2851 family protein [Bacteroidales bacterium]